MLSFFTTLISQMIIDGQLFHLPGISKDLESPQLLPWIPPKELFLPGVPSTSCLTQTQWLGGLGGEPGHLQFTAAARKSKSCLRVPLAGGEER